MYHPVLDIRKHRTSFNLSIIQNTAFSVPESGVYESQSRY